VALIKPDSTEKAYGALSVPHYVLIDKTGRVRQVFIGATKANIDSMQSMIRQLIDE
jgi:hypothetical protein